MAYLDQIDRKLLRLLQANDRLPLITLSKRVGLAPSSINQRIKRLIKEGVITGFHARVDPEKLGLDLLAFIMVGWSDPKVEPAFLRKAKASKVVLECHHVTGVWNYMLKIRVRSMKEIESFLAATIKSVRGVERTETILILSTAKEETALDPLES